ncbi:MAG TPA: hypothetical protein VJ552_05405 [Sediminibacterium sp.]|nr:hypothetical protein [Sediminibacterium sp.]
MAAGRKNNSGEHNVALRVRAVQEWLLQDHQTTDIIRQGTQLWNVSKRQVQRYIDTAKEGFREANEDVIEKKKAYYIQRSKKMLRDLEARHKNTPSGIFAQMAVLQFQAKIEGVMVDKHDHVHSFEGEVFIGGEKVNSE